MSVSKDVVWSTISVVFLWMVCTVALAHPHEGNYFEIGKHATEKVRECMKGVSHVIDPEWGDGTFYEMCAIKPYLPHIIVFLLDQFLSYHFSKFNTARTACTVGTCEP